MVVLTLDALFVIFVRHVFVVAEIGLAEYGLAVLVHFFETVVFGREHVAALVVEGGIGIHRLTIDFIERFVVFGGGFIFGDRPAVEILVGNHADQSEVEDVVAIVAIDVAIGVERLVDLEQQFVRGALICHLFPVDDAVDEIDGLVVGRERQQDAAIHHVRFALVDEFRLEPDRRLVGEDLHVVVGYPAQQRAGRHIVQPLDLMVGAAFVGQPLAKKSDDRVFDAGSKVEQDGIGAEIAQFRRFQRFDRREGALAQQARPIIVRPHLHAPLVLPDGRGRRFYFVGCIERVFVISAPTAAGRSELSAKRIHALSIPRLKSLSGIFGGAW